MNSPSAMYNFQDKIIDFNADSNVIKQKELYNRPSFFEIISKSRSETTYSSFLKWLFKDSYSSFGDLSPIMLLLDILVKKSYSSDEKKDRIDEELKRLILSREIRINSINAEVEKSVGTLVREAANLYNGKNKKHLTKSKDKIDIYISGDISLLDKDIAGSRKKIQIIIENKVDSSEGEGKTDAGTGFQDYDQLSQTQRYFYATQQSENSLYQIYVYLTPEHVKKGPEDNHFIHITYQDIVDGILNPLLTSSSLSSRSRFFIEEFQNQLTYPCLDNVMIRQSIAVGNNKSKVLTEIWDSYELLIIGAILASTDSDTILWRYKGAWYNSQPRIELAKDLKNMGIQEAGSFIDESNNWVPHRRFEGLKKLNPDYVKNNLKEGNPETFISENTTNVPEDTKLLASFWLHNQRFLMALVEGIKNEKRVQIGGLLSEINRRDYSKYTLVHTDKNKQEIVGTGLGKRGVIEQFFIYMMKHDPKHVPTNFVTPKQFYYSKIDFEMAFNNQKITDDEYKNRYSLITIKGVGEYRVYNQWGIAYWPMVITKLNQLGFDLIEE